MDNKFQLWSPPLLDLSLDSFSNELIQELDKTRTTGTQIKKSDITQEQLDSLEIINTNNNLERNNSILSSSPIASSVTLPEPSIHEEDSSSTSNLFRKSSTFLKKKLSQSQKKDETSSISTTEDISNIISRQYPPKPLHYSPVVDPPSDTTPDTESAASSPSIRESVPTVKSNRMSNPISVISTPSAPVPAPTTTTTNNTQSAPKRRSFFSLRFC